MAADVQTYAIIAADVILESVCANEVMSTLLKPLRCRIEQVSADGAYDTNACHKLLKNKGIKAVIPPRSNAAVDALKAGSLSDCKQQHHYGKRSLAETAMYRYKQLISPPLTLRDYNAQVGEALAGVKAMNKMLSLGMPLRGAGR